MTQRFFLEKYSLEYDTYSLNSHNRLDRKTQAATKGLDREEKKNSSLKFHSKSDSSIHNAGLMS
jgi:hypothetical protein